MANFMTRILWTLMFFISIVALSFLMYVFLYLCSIDCAPLAFILSVIIHGLAWAEGNKQARALYRAKTGRIYNE